MAHTFTNLWFHLISGTKGYAPSIESAVRAPLHALPRIRSTCSSDVESAGLSSFAAPRLGDFRRWEIPRAGRPGLHSFAAPRLRSLFAVAILTTRARTTSEGWARVG